MLFFTKYLVPEPKEKLIILLPFIESALKDFNSFANLLVISSTNYISLNCKQVLIFFYKYRFQELQPNFVLTDFLSKYAFFYVSSHIL